MEIVRVWYPDYGRYMWAVYCQFRGYVREELETYGCARDALADCFEAMNYDE